MAVLVAGRVVVVGGASLLTALISSAAVTGVVFVTVVDVAGDGAIDAGLEDVAGLTVDSSIGLLSGMVGVTGGSAISYVAVVLLVILSAEVVEISTVPSTTSISTFDTFSMQCDVLSDTGAVGILTSFLLNSEAACAKKDNGDASDGSGGDSNAGAISSEDFEKKASAVCSVILLWLSLVFTYQNLKDRKR